MVGQRAGRVQRFDQILERHVLVCIGRQGGFTHPAQQLPKARIASRVSAQHQCVDKETDQIVQRLVGAAGDGAADGNVVASAQARQQCRQAGLQHHEQAGPGLPGQPRQALVQLGVDPHRQVIALIGGHRRARPVGWQVDLSGQIGQGLCPILQLLDKQAARVGGLAQQFSLPQRVIGILHRQRHPGRCLALAAGGVSAGQIAGQRCHGPAVAGDVMHQQQQDMLARPQDEQLDPQGRLAGQINAVLRGCGQGIGQGGFGGFADHQSRLAHFRA